MTPPLLRSAAPARACPHGHDLTNPANAYHRRRSGGRVVVECRTCKRDWQRDRYHAARRRLAVVAAPPLVENLAPAAYEYDATDPLVVTRADGVECYRIDEWHRRYGRPPVAYTILEDDR